MLSPAGRSLGVVRGYDERSYGEGMADVYDDWYAGITPVADTVARMLDVAGEGGRVLELGVGTGRLAIPMAGAGLRVVGVDTSEAMLAKLADLDPAGIVEVLCADMVDDLPAGPFDAALVAYNTIFNLLDEATQQRCFRSVAERLRPGGCFVVEAFVPDVERHASTPSDVSVRSMSVDHVVLSVSINDPASQRAEGQFVEFTESGGVRLRPWAVRWCTPTQLDSMASAAGFDQLDRFADMAGTPFDDDATSHVSIYRRRTDG